MQVISCADADETVAECYSSRTGWDPRQETEAFVFIIATPRTVKAWRSLPEIKGRTIMRGGAWVSPVT